MCPGVIVVVGIGPKDLTKMRLTQDHDVVEALSSDRAYEPFDVSVGQGERGAVGRSRIPIAARRRVTT